MSEEKEIEITIKVRIPRKGLTLRELERLIDQAGDKAKQEALEEALQEEAPEKPHECRE